MRFLLWMLATFAGTLLLKTVVVLLASSAIAEELPGLNTIIFLGLGWGLAMAFGSVGTGDAMARVGIAFSVLAACALFAAGTCISYYHTVQVHKAAGTSELSFGKAMEDLDEYLEEKTNMRGSVGLFLYNIQYTIYTEE